MELVEPFLSDSRVTYRRNPVNMGAAKLAEHWNLLLGLCSSDYVIVASDDDIYDKKFLEEVESVLQNHPSVDLVHVRARVIDEHGFESLADGPMNDYMSFKEHIIHYINPHSVLCIGNYVFRTAALTQSGGFVNLPLAWKADSATAIMLSKAGVACPPDILFSFRRSGINISTQHGDNETDKMKTEATLSFYSSSVLPLGLEPDILMSFQKKLGGEIRNYYHSFSRSEFLYVLKRMNHLEMFASIRNRVSFIWFWLKSK